MQEDEAFDETLGRGIATARATGEPYYTGIYTADGLVCLHDETGRFPDKPEGCHEQWRAEQESRSYRGRLKRALEGVFGHHATPANGV